MKLTNNFVQGKMNKDLDERLIPKGQYPHAENIRVASSDASDAGAIENVKGNKALTSLGLSDGKTIGSFTDGSNQKIYWFITSQFKDLVMEYDKANSVTTVLLESSRPNGLLNFDKDFLITGVTKIINGDSKRDLLCWTDDINPIRTINIERAKTYPVDGFTNQDISLLKRAPRFAPETQLTYTSSQLENTIEDSFFQFMYRYKYLDGEYSALSSMSNAKFAPKDFRLDYQTMENEGMVNAFNAVDIKFNTGDRNVTDIQLVVKETNSNATAVIETFNKVDEGWSNNETRNFLFANSKKYVFLPEDELFRSFDNVPRFAKAMELINNRLVFGNYVENYDLIDNLGRDVVMDYNISLVSRSLEGATVPVSFSAVPTVNDTLIVNLAGQELRKNSRVTFDINLVEPTYSGSYQNIFSFILNRDYTSLTELSLDPDFVYFLEEVMTNDFLTNYDTTQPTDSEVLSSTKFLVVGSTLTTLSIKAPSITYKVDNTPTNPSDSDFTTVITSWAYRTTSTTASYRSIAINSSIKTNRSYEVGVIYLDDDGRKTTVLTSKKNTIKVPQEFSTSQNAIVVELNNQPPAFADRYKLVVKQNKSDYQTIYTNLFYEDGLFRWVKIEGANKDKVREGQTLIVKSDLGGTLSDLIKVRVLELATKEKDFIEDNQNSDGDDIIEEAGLYMKIKPTGFDMNFGSATARTFEGSSHLRDPVNTYTNPRFGEGTVSGTNFVPYSLSAGSSVRIFIEFKARGSIAYKETYDKSFRVNADYTSIQAWFEAEVTDLGSFGEDFTRGFGFSPSGEQFYVRAHRDGTTTRSITTRVSFEVLFSEGIVIFETEPDDLENNIFYETEQTFEIVNGFHLGNLQDQSTSSSSAIIELDFFNCYAQGNGAESYRYKDAFNKKFLNIDTKPTTTSPEKYREVRRFSDLTYGEPYNENANLNGLNEFNLSKANFKEDIDKKYGFIQKLYARDTDLVVFQEDKVTKVLYGKDLLMNADGSYNVTAIDSILGRQVPVTGEYGISRNPESFAVDSNNIYFTDAKRGCVCRMGLNGVTEISMMGMTTYFRESYRNNIDTKKFGAYDPFYDQYVLHNSGSVGSRAINMNCSQSFEVNDFSGTVLANIDFGLDVGVAGISFTSNGVPVRYDLEYNGKTYSTGFLGDSSYNDELVVLGYPEVVGSGNASLGFPKDLSSARFAKVTITAPICGTDINVSGLCVVSDSLIVVSVIVNDAGDATQTMKSRYQWTNGGSPSLFKVYNSEFGEGLVELYDVNSGNEGTPDFPVDGSNVEIQSYKGSTETGSFVEGNKLGYFVSNTLYTASEVLALANYLTVTQEVTVGGVINKGNFTFNKDSKEYLYLVWDYRNGQTVLVDDTLTLDNGATSSVNVLANDTIVGTPVVTIQTEPSNGFLTINPDNSISYTHNGTATLSDSFVYRVFDGVNTNTATVFVTINEVIVEPQPTFNFYYEAVHPLAHPSDDTVTYIDAVGDTIVFVLTRTESGINPCQLIVAQSIVSTNGAAPCSPEPEPTVTVGSLTANVYDDTSYFLNVNLTLSGSVTVDTLFEIIVVTGGGAYTSFLTILAGNNMGSDNIDTGSLVDISPVISVCASSSDNPEVSLEVCMVL
jgi:hypothetical protein